jgi:aspartyl-tRNA(Asn)/glutamyl-tRNA(Gln) amidotransferase subunit C
MSLTRAEVQHIAELAKLQLTEAEEALYQVQLSDILDYMQRLNALDTAAIPPTATVLPLRNIMRDDAPRSSLPVEEVLANAPQQDEDSHSWQAAAEAERDGAGATDPLAGYTPAVGERRRVTCLPEQPAGPVGGLLLRLS